MKIDLKQKKVIITCLVIVIAIVVTMFIYVKSIKNKKISNSNEQSGIEYNKENILDENSTDENVEDDNFVDLSDENVENTPDVVDDSSKTNSENDNMNIESKKANSSKYYIKINNSTNKINIYEKDENGEYTKLAKQMICSTGKFTPSCRKYPKRIYALNGQHYRWTKLQGNVYGQYVTRITGHILFHSVPYKRSNPSTLEYWEFDKLGTSASRGCIRLQVKDAKWIYENIPKGTIVEFNSNITNNASAPKISSNVECRNWDPTDTDSNNPWKPSKSTVNTNSTQSQKIKKQQPKAEKQKKEQPKVEKTNNTTENTKPKNNVIKKTEQENKTNEKTAQENVTKVKNEQENTKSQKENIQNKSDETITDDSNAI